MVDQDQKMNVFDVSMALDRIKHMVGLTAKYEKKTQFIPWRNFWDGQDDYLDKMAEMGYVVKSISPFSGDAYYAVSFMGFLWLQDFVSVEILLPVERMRKLV